MRSLASHDDPNGSQRYYIGHEIIGLKSISLVIHTVCDSNAILIRIPNHLITGTAIVFPQAA